LFTPVRFLHGNQKFPTFEAFFEEILGKPFATWAELEATYQFASRIMPKLLAGDYATANRTMKEAKKDAAEQRGPGNLLGTNQYTAEARVDADGQRAPGGTVDNINNSSTRPDGTSRRRALRKLRQEAEKPDATPRVKEVYARVLNEEITPHRGMIEAGFREETYTIPADPLRAAQVIIRRFAIEDVRKVADALQGFIKEAG
jgi:hypothetical protein